MWTCMGRGGCNTLSGRRENRVLAFADQGRHGCWGRGLGGKRGVHSMDQSRRSNATHPSPDYMNQCNTPKVTRTDTVNFHK